MSLQEVIDNRLILQVPAHTPITADLACNYILQGNPHSSCEGWREMVPRRLRALSDFNAPGNTDKPYHYLASFESVDIYIINTNSVSWRVAHPEYVPNHNIHLNNTAPQRALSLQVITNANGEPRPFNGDNPNPQDDTDNSSPPDNEHQLLAVPEPNLDHIVVPPGMTQEATKIHVVELNQMADPKYRDECFKNCPELFDSFENKRQFVSNKWKIASYNPHLRIPVINIVVALDDDNSWIKVLLKELTTPLGASPDDSIIPVSAFEYSYIAIPSFALSETERRRFIGYSVLLKCMEDSQQVKNKVIESLISWENTKPKRIFIRTMLGITTCNCLRNQVIQLFSELNPHSSWCRLISQVRLSLK